MKSVLFIVLGLLISITFFAQQTGISCNQIGDNEIQKLIEEDKLIINEELVLNVIEYRKEEQYTSFTEIYYNLQGRERTEFIREYLKADLDIESLEDIRKRVIEQNGGEYTEIVNITDEDIDWFIQVKAQMTNRLNNIELTNN